MLSRLFKSEGFVALADSDTGEIFIEFLHARYMSPIRFVLQKSEMDKYGDVKYIGTLIESYYRNASKFCSKRRVLGA